MRRQIIAELLQEYQRERDDADARAGRLHREVAEKAPLYDRLGAELARIALRSAETGEDPKALVYDLRDRARIQLAEAGYKPEELEPPYRCPLCRDTGYVDIPKRPCECFERRLREKLIARSGLGSAPGHTFAHFNPDVFSDEAEKGLSQRETMRRLERFARGYAENFPDNEKRDLTFTGPSGLGKTFLADCIAARVMERGFGVLRMTAFRLIEALRRHHMGRDEDGELEIILSADLLLIDDLGTEPLFQNISGEYMFTLINERQQAKKSTIIATNLTLAELRDRYTERFTSRLLNAECAAAVPFSGRDVRLRRREPN